jgi:hypothetical protein
MTTSKVLIEKDFFYFDERVTSRVINPRHIERFSTYLNLNQRGTHKHTYLSNYDIEIFPRDNEANVFCNIKTKLTWDFEVNNQQELGSYQFAESLLFHTLNQRHFMTTILRQETINNLGSLGLLSAPVPKTIYEHLKKEFDFLTPFKFENTNIWSWNSHWY